MKGPRALRALTALRPTANLENPQVSITGAALSDLWDLDGRADSSPQSIVTAMRCIDVIAGAVAGSPLRTRNAAGDDVVVPALSFERTRLTRAETMELVVKSQLLHGYAFLVKLRRGGASRVTGLGLLDPAAVTRVYLGELGELLVDINTSQGTQTRTEDDLVWLPSPVGFDGLVGISVVESMRRSLSVAASASRAAERLMDNGMMAQGVIMTPEVMTRAQKSDVKASWRSKMSTGVSSLSEVVIMDGGAKFQELSMRPADAQFLQTRQFQDREIARGFGVPAALIDIESESDIPIEDLTTVLARFTLSPLVRRIEERLTRAVCPNGVSAWFDLAGLMRGSAQARAAFYNSGITGAWLTPNDVRRREGLPDVEWGDEPWLPNNLAAVAQDPRVETQVST